MDLIFLAIAIFDGIIVAMFIAALAMRLFGDSPIARLLRLILSIGSGIGYFLLRAHLGWGETNASMGAFFGSILTPCWLYWCSKSNRLHVQKISVYKPTDNMLDAQHYLATGTTHNSC